MKLFELEVNNVYRTDDLLSKEFEAMLATKAKAPYSIWYDLSSKFDEWDLEKIFYKIERFNPRELLIAPTHDTMTQPTYSAICEMRDALGALCTECVDVGSGYKRYKYNNTYIYFTTN